MRLQTRVSLPLPSLTVSYCLSSSPHFRRKISLPLLLLPSPHFSSPTHTHYNTSPPFTPLTTLSNFPLCPLLSLISLTSLHFLSPPTSLNSFPLTSPPLIFPSFPYSPSLHFLYYSSPNFPPLCIPLFPLTSPAFPPSFPLLPFP